MEEIKGRSKSVDLFIRYNLFKGFIILSARLLLRNVSLLFAANLFFFFLNLGLFFGSLIFDEFLENVTQKLTSLNFFKNLTLSIIKF